MSPDNKKTIFGKNDQRISGVLQLLIEVVYLCTEGIKKRTHTHEKPRSEREVGKYH